MTWKATVFLDALLDEDYYGNGVCQWQLISTTAGLAATASGDVTTFVAEIWLEQLRAQQTMRHYYLKTSYPRGSFAGAVMEGVDDPRKLPERLRHQLFSILTTVKAIP